jgi:4a-hydroxytetrahydrobiopterin dehydratase
MTKSDPKIYTESEIQARLQAELPGWRLQDGWIRRKYKTGGWPQTLMAVNALGYLAEAVCHHPDLEVSYAEVHVKLMTHSAKGITDNDLELAKLIEKHLTWQPTPEDDTPFAGYEAMMKKKWVRGDDKDQ